MGMKGAELAKFALISSLFACSEPRKEVQQEELPGVEIRTVDYSAIQKAQELCRQQYEACVGAAQDGGTTDGKKVFQCRDEANTCAEAARKSVR